MSPLIRSPAFRCAPAGRRRRAASEPSDPYRSCARASRITPNACRSIERSGRGLFRHHLRGQPGKELRIFLLQVRPAPVGGGSARFKGPELNAVGSRTSMGMPHAAAPRRWRRVPRAGALSGAVPLWARARPQRRLAAHAAVRARRGARRSLRQGEVLHADPRFLRPFSFRILFQERLVGFRACRHRAPSASRAPHTSSLTRAWAWAVNSPLGYFFKNCSYASGVLVSRAFCQSLCWRLQPQTANSIAQPMTSTNLLMTIFPLKRAISPGKRHSTSICGLSRRRQARHIKYRPG